MTESTSINRRGNTTARLKPAKKAKPTASISEPSPPQQSTQYHQVPDIPSRRSSTLVCVSIYKNNYTLIVFLKLE